MNTVLLPPLLVVTDRAQAAAAGRTLKQVLRQAVCGGARAVVVRERDLPPQERAELVRWACALLAAAGGLVIVAAPGTGRGAGLQLPAAAAVPATRPPLLGRSCHSAAELRDAALEHCDYATLSPVFASASKPGYGPALGTAALADGRLPVYALGGVTVANAGACLAAGAAGVAVMGAVMRAVDPAAAAAGLLAALDRAR